VPAILIIFKKTGHTKTTSGSLMLSISARWPKPLAK
jgi:hypothetical protein